MSSSQPSSRVRPPTQPSAIGRLGNGLLSLALFVTILATLGYLTYMALAALGVITV